MIDHVDDNERAMVLGVPAGAVPAKGPRHWHEIWLRAITRPTVSNFMDLLSDPDVTLRRAVRWIILVALGGGLLSWAIDPGILRFEPDGWTRVSVGLDGRVVAGGVGIFLFHLFLQHALAKSLGGQGSCRRLGFIMAAYSAPLTLIGAALSGADGYILASSTAISAPIQPGLGIIQTLQGSSVWYLGASLILSLVRCGLNSVAMRAVYKLGPWEAFLPPLAAFGLTACMAWGLTSLVGQ